MIKIIKNLEPWEVMKRASEGEPVALRRQSGDWKEIGTPHWNWGEQTYAIIDMSTPSIDWKQFDYDFFNSYGGLCTRIGHVKGYITDADDVSFFKISGLRESPFYYWSGGACPVPGNVEVETICRTGTRNTLSSNKFRWHQWYADISTSDIIAFRLTGNVL